ncbi:uncharacterized protein LOC125532135 isoform X2 [Triticum urartu]|uniref:uncharacterized protein LOC125532135 isoform X2 n=1 Tax=Triticum urartu TaxID=4572 RepID=UPI002043F466|nr:uncharacterized protein LOC125532135 isoform X2 [Triticum urartu]
MEAARFLQPLADGDLPAPRRHRPGRSYSSASPARGSPPCRRFSSSGEAQINTVQPSLCIHIDSYGSESFFKVFLFLVLVHASTEISKYIWAILVFFLMRILIFLSRKYLSILPASPYINSL